MRIVILLNPKLPVEHKGEGQKYAEASVGFDAELTGVEDKRGLANALRAAADMMCAPESKSP